jgi:demethylmenaquinone methyltransferase/2-methoxy-6-polyprenyl-1,4-benzoquinol methylase
MTSRARDELPQGEDKRAAVRSMFDSIAPRYDLVNRIMTLRMDVGWRRTTIRRLALPPGAVVADLACGTGDFCAELHRAGHRPIGVDLSLGMLQAARTAVPLVQGDLLTLPLATESVDAAVCGFALRNLVSLPPFLAELQRVVRPGGRVGLLDVSTPDNRLLGWGHQLYFNRVVPRIGGLLSDRSAYEYLPRSVSYLPPPAELVRMLEEAGLTNIDRSQLSAGIAQLLVATSPMARP